jgi:hypothetical protein
VDIRKVFEKHTWLWSYCFVSEYIFSARSQNCENRPVASSWLSTWKERHDEAWDNTAPTGQIFTQSGIWIFLETLSGKFRFYSNLTWIPMYIYDNMLLNSSLNENVAEQTSRDNQNTYLIVSNILPLKILAFTRLSGKICYSLIGCTWKYHLVHAHHMLDK